MMKFLAYLFLIETRDIQYQLYFSGYFKRFTCCHKESIGNSKFRFSISFIRRPEPDQNVIKVNVISS